MQFGEWKARLVEDFASPAINLYLYRHRPGGTEVLTHDGSVKLYKSISDHSAQDYFARFIDEEQLQALANALAAKGVRTDNDHKNKGLLIATKAHLEDMRMLVFKGKAPGIKQ